MKHKELKKEMLENGKYSEIRKINSSLIKQGSSITNMIDTELKCLVDEIDICEVIGQDSAKQIAIENTAKYIDCSSEELKAFQQMQHAKKVKAKKMEQDIIKALSKGYGYMFATLTFEDKYIDEREPRTRRKYIKKYLEQFDGYIANIDYGKDNGREHYHALIFIKSEILDHFETEIHKDKKKQFRHFIKQNQLPVWKYGYYSLEKEYENLQKDEDKSPRKLSNYIAKINNHSLKIEQKQVLKNLNKL